MDPTETVRQFIISNFYVPHATTLKDDDPLLEHGVVDSTGVLEVIHFIEETYGFKLDDDEIIPENLGSISNIAALVERKVGPGWREDRRPQKESRDGRRSRTTSLVGRAPTSGLPS